MTRVLRCSCVAIAVLALSACNSDLTPTRRTPPPPPPPPTPTLYRLSGIVTDDNGRPVANAEVVLENYPRGDNLAVTSTNVDGHYQLVVETIPGLVNLIQAGGGEYERLYIQALPSETSDIVKNLRLQRIRTVEAGQSIVISIDRDSSLAYDGEDWTRLDGLWEKLHVRVADAGTLTVDARPEVGGVVPSLAVFCVFVADNCRFNWVKPPAGSGTGSLIVNSNSLFEIRVAIPSARAPQRYEVVTSVQR